MISQLSILLSLSLTGCAISTPFISSSLDHNKKKSQTTILAGTDVKMATVRVKSVFKSLNLKLEKTGKCDAKSCFLQYLGANKSMEQTSVTYDTTTNAVLDVKKTVMIHYSVYFVKVLRNKRGIKVMIVGVPKVNKDMSCPELVRKKLAKCEVEYPPVGLNDDLAGKVYEEWKIDVSGKVEYYFIKEVLAKLRGIRSPSAPTQPNNETEKGLDPDAI